MENKTNTDNITFVSCYYNVKNKYNHETYSKWFKNSLNINQRYIFFCKEEDNDFIRTFRNGYETIFINYSIADFYSNNFYNDNWVDNYHCPSIELGKIWHEKIHLLKLAKDYDVNFKSSTTYYMWVDAGICIFRNYSPPPVRINYYKSEKEKVFYSDSNEHSITGCYMIHKNIIDLIHHLYYDTLNTNKKSLTLLTDQHLLALILNQYPEYFFKACTGYGKVLCAIVSLLI